MSPRILLRLCFSVLLLRAEAGGTKELNGILGESIIFQVNASSSFKTISWTKIDDNIPRTIAMVTFGEPCDLVVPFPPYRKRVNISKDCRELHLSQLEKEDAGRYTAGIVLSTSETMDEPFELRVFRRLLDSEMRLNCTPDAAGNGNWKLICSAGTWEDRVKFSWSSNVQSKNPPRIGNSAILTSQDLNLKVTCAAENPVSKASRTVSLKEACAEKEQLARRGWIGAVTLLVINILLLIATAVYVRMRKAAKKNGCFTKHSV